MRIFLKFVSGLVRFLLFSNSSKAVKALFEFLIETKSLEIFLLHDLRSYLRVLNFPQRTVATLEACTSLFQEFVTVFKNPG